MRQKRLLVVTRLRDCIDVVPGSDATRVCFSCGERVCVAPSGQREIRERRTAVICTRCFMGQQRPSDRVILAEGFQDDLRSWLFTRNDSRH